MFYMWVLVRDNKIFNVELEDFWQGSGEVFQIVGYENLERYKWLKIEFFFVFKFYMGFVIFYWKSVIVYINGVLKLFFCFFFIGMVGYFGFVIYSYRVNILLYVIGSIKCVYFKCYWQKGSLGMCVYSMNVVGIFFVVIV